MFRALLFAVAHYVVHHLADIGQASPSLGVGLGAVASSTLLFQDNPFQDGRAALIFEAILLDGSFGVAETKTHRVRIVERVSCHRWEGLVVH
jgi:hypothetical protein